MCIRRSTPGGRTYFIANRSSRSVESWVPVRFVGAGFALFDPLTGSVRNAPVQRDIAAVTLVYLQLPPGGSVFLHCFKTTELGSAATDYWPGLKRLKPLAGNWQVKFLSGGPELPAPFTSDKLDSWTRLGDTNAQRFAGTALYTLRFDKPAGDAGGWQLDLGKVCQSARVRLNGSDHGMLITPPFRVLVSEGQLKPKDNFLEIEVTSTAANRIRDLDRRGVNWKNFHDINFVNLDYQPFDAANWPLADAGLLSPVTLTPAAAAAHPAN